MRSCDLHAIAVQDRTFLEGSWVDRDYRARREGAFIVAVNCGQAGGTCFCVSMDTGPRADAGFDLALTELLDDGGHRFLVEVGSERGAEVLAELPHRARRRRASAGGRAGGRATPPPADGRARSTPTGIRDLLYRNREHPRWDEVADRCLTCGNCTMVCPTCFCASVEDVTDLAGEEASRERRWESCFTLEHSYVHGGSVHGSGKARYRQWMTHKLATWIDQFGTSGCVGCGRCITWCPVAIDITEEAAAIRATDLGAEAEGAMRTIDALLERVPRLRRAGAERAGADRRLRAGTACSSAGEQLLREGEPADAFYVIRTGPWRSRPTCPSAAR